MEQRTRPWTERLETQKFEVKFNYKTWPSVLAHISIALQSDFCKHEALKAAFEVKNPVICSMYMKKRQQHITVFDIPLQLEQRSQCDKHSRHASHFDIYHFQLLIV